MSHERQGLFDHAVYINVGGFPRSGARKIEQIVNDLAGAKRLLDDFFNDRLARVAFRHLLSEHLNVVGNDRERRIHFVRDAGGEQPKRSQLFRLRHLLFHALALGHVIEEQETANPHVRFAYQWRDGDVQRKRFPVMLESLFIDAGNLFLVSPRGDFARQFFRQQRTELASDGFLARHAKKLLHARVPGFHQAFQINRQHPDVEGFHDILAEVLETSDLQGFLFERTVKLCVVEGHGKITGNGMFADTAGDKVVEVELLERVPNGIADVSCRTGRLKKEPRAGKLGPGRLEESEIQRLGKAHAHRTGNAQLAGLHRVFHKNREAIDKQRLRDTVHDRAQHGVETHFVRQGASELNEGAAVIEAVTVEKAVQAPLNPCAERLKQKRGQDDSDHAADGAIRRRMENLSAQRDQGEIKCGDTGRCRGIRQAALKNNVHIHKSITNYGVAEA